jgi:hypothetical protein
LDIHKLKNEFYGKFEFSFKKAPVKLPS